MWLPPAPLWQNSTSQTRIYRWSQKTVRLRSSNLHQNSAKHGGFALASYAVAIGYISKFSFHNNVIFFHLLRVLLYRPISPSQGHTSRSTQFARWVGWEGSKHIFVPSLSTIPFQVSHCLWQEYLITFIYYFPIICIVFLGCIQIYGYKSKHERRRWCE